MKNCKKLSLCIGSHAGLWCYKCRIKPPISNKQNALILRQNIRKCRHLRRLSNCAKAWQLDCWRAENETRFRFVGSFSSAFFGFVASDRTSLPPPSVICFVFKSKSSQSPANKVTTSSCIKTNTPLFPLPIREVESGMLLWFAFLLKFSESLTNTNKVKTYQDQHLPTLEAESGSALEIFEALKEIAFPRSLPPLCCIGNNIPIVQRYFK